MKFKILTWDPTRDTMCSEKHDSMFWLELDNETVQFQRNLSGDIVASGQISHTSGWLYSPTDLSFWFRICKIQWQGAIFLGKHQLQTLNFGESFKQPLTPPYFGEQNWGFFVKCRRLHSLEIKENFKYKVVMSKWCIKLNV